MSGGTISLNRDVEAPPQATYLSPTQPPTPQMKTITKGHVRGMGPPNFLQRFSPLPCSHDCECASMRLVPSYPYHTTTTCKATYPYTCWVVSSPVLPEWPSEWP